MCRRKECDEINLTKIIEDLRKAEFMFEGPISFAQLLPDVTPRIHYCVAIGRLL
jgi:hypothetical protein